MVSKVQEVTLDDPESEYETDYDSDSPAPFLRRLQARACPSTRTLKVYTASALTKAGSLVWILATSFLVLGFPLAVSMEREASLLELDKQLKGQGMPLQ